jgi:ABC-type transport system involved in cytochrome c biogenesis permease component
MTLFYAFLSIIIGFLSILKEGDALLSLKLSPIDPLTLFFSKVLFSLLLSFLLSLVYVSLVSFFSSTFFISQQLIASILLTSIYIASLSALVSLMIIYTEAGVLLSATLMLALGVPFFQQLPSSLYESIMGVLPSNLLFTSTAFLFVSSILSRHLIEI